MQTIHSTLCNTSVQEGEPSLFQLYSQRAVANGLRASKGKCEQGVTNCPPSLPSLNTQSWKEEGRVAPRHSFLSLRSIRQSAVRSLLLFTLLESFVWVSFWPRTSFRYGVAQRDLSPKILSFSQPFLHYFPRTITTLILNIKLLFDVCWY